MTPDSARKVLEQQLSRVIPEERGPLWETWPWQGHRTLIESTAARAAAETRREHLQRLIAQPDTVLRDLIARGWDPRDRGTTTA